ncbi:ABC transporter ATP-binding protein [Pasteurella canis]|uniref:ABC transporter ATP-binding protein n=1 Tax=Pasteurella canis TaxID=753 RepID=A0A379ES70_9PAST|nr:ABC transporter ATP-binding protein [Pasteurella canis]
MVDELSRVPDSKLVPQAEQENNQSSVNRKEQKRREAELRQQTAPLRKKLQQFEMQMDNLSTKLVEIETQLGESELYLAENKDKLTTLLAEQVSHKKQLEEIEMQWLALQEELEELLAE